MDYARQQRNPAKHLAGIAVVVLVHAAIAYVLVAGLARKTVEVVKPPIETKIIEEVKPPPAPEIPLPPPPKFEAPPPPYVPPPEIRIQQTPPSQPAITVTTEKPPEAPPPPAVVRAPPPEAPPAPPAAPAPLTASAVCTNYKAVLQDARDTMAAIAQRQGFSTAEVLVEFVVTASGHVQDVHIVKSSNRALNGAVRNAIAQFSCDTRGRDARFALPITFRLED